MMLVKYLLVTMAAVVGGVMAVKCDAQQQFDQCKKDMQGNVDRCGPNDAKCLCAAHKIILNNCYPLCPKDDGKGSQESMVSSWCVSAGGDKDTTTVAIVTPTITTSPGATGTATVAPSGPATYTATGTSTSTSTDTPSNNETETTTTTKSQTTGGAGNMAPTGFMVAAVAVVGLMF